MALPNHKKNETPSVSAGNARGVGAQVNSVPVVPGSRQVRGAGGAGARGAEDAKKNQPAGWTPGPRKHIVCTTRHWRPGAVDGADGQTNIEKIPGRKVPDISHALNASVPAPQAQSGSIPALARNVPTAPSRVQPIVLARAATKVEIQTATEAEYAEVAVPCASARDVVVASVSDATEIPETELLQKVSAAISTRSTSTHPTPRHSSATTSIARVSLTPGPLASHAPAMPARRPVNAVPVRATIICSRRGAEESEIAAALLARRLKRADRSHVKAREPLAARTATVRNVLWWRAARASVRLRQLWIALPELMLPARVRALASDHITAVVHDSVLSSVDDGTTESASHALCRNSRNRSPLVTKSARLLNAMNHHPPAARLMALCAVGIFAVAAAVIVAKNELQRSSKVPALKVFNSQVADERYRMTKERAELLRRMIVAYGLVHGASPESLDDLVPGFLPGIPAPLNGTDRWEYARTESNAEHPDITGFTLSFRSWAHPLYRQERVNGEGLWSMAE